MLHDIIWLLQYHYYFSNKLISLVSHKPLILSIKDRNILSKYKYFVLGKTKNKFMRQERGDS